MKRRLIIVSIFVLLLAACGGQAADSGKLHVVATTNIIGDVVGNIGGDLIELDVLLPVGVDPHSFQPVPQDLAAISDADVVLINGLGLEEFLRDLLDNTDSTAKIVDLSQGLDLIENDPHVWLDAANVIVWTGTIADALTEMDPENGDAYRASAASYQAELADLHQSLLDGLGAIPAERRVMVTDHDAFLYFARAYEVMLVGAVIPSFSTLAEPSAQELAALQDAIRDLGVPAVFVGTTVSPSIVQRVAEDTGTTLVTLYTGSLSAADGPAGTYTAMMTFNLNAIVQALR